MPLQKNKEPRSKRCPTEGKFQSNLIKRLKNTFPGCVVMKTDSTYLQGAPDLLVLFEDKWAALECKRTRHSPHRPNQDYYVDLMNRMSFSRFIFPENEEEIFCELEQTFRP